MEAECCRNSTEFEHGRYQARLFSKNIYQLSRVCRASSQIVPSLAFVLLLIAVNAAAQSRSDTPSKLVQGSLVTAQAPPRPGYTVSATMLGVPAKARMHLRSAHRKFAKGNFSGASAEIDRSLQLAPDFAQALSMRALVKLAIKDFEGATEDAARAAYLDPVDPSPCLALAAGYNSLHEFEKAEEAARQALNLDPKSWEARLEMAKSLYGQGEFVRALRELDLLNKNFPDVHLVRGNVLMRLGRGAEAAEEFGVFQAEAPNDPRCDQVRRLVANLRQP
jgi:tetratricopeptide (TPR) repeat protein